MKQETTYQAVLGILLAEKRKEKGWDQADAARESGINRSSWSRLENGATAPDTIQLARIAKAFNTTPHSFLAEVQKNCDKLTEAGITVHLEKRKQSSGKMGGLLLGGAILGAAIAIASASLDDKTPTPKDE